MTSWSQNVMLKMDAALAPDGEPLIAAESVADAIRATIHEAARRVCTCLPGEFLEREGHEERCPARKVLEMEASGG